LWVMCVFVMKFVVYMRSVAKYQVGSVCHLVYRLCPRTRAELRDDYTCSPKRFILFMSRLSMRIQRHVKTKFTRTESDSEIRKK
jgi:hypothetical protein